MNVLYSLVIAALLAVAGWAADAYLPAPVGLILGAVLWIAAGVVVIRMLLALSTAGPRGGPGA